MLREKPTHCTATARASLSLLLANTYTSWPGVSRRSAPQDYGSRASSRLDLDRDGARIVGVSGASDLAGGDRTAWLAMEDSKCAGRPARSRWCKSTTMK